VLWNEDSNDREKITESAMVDSDDKKWIVEIKLPVTCTADLRGRQSVRATFKLSSACIDAISVVSKHLGIKQKSLFDHLAEDVNALKSIAREVRKTKQRREHLVQKTFVISRRSLCSLEQVSKNFNAPRDSLVEYSVQRLLPLIESECRNQEKRKKMLTAVKKHFRSGALLLAKWEKVLGEEDPLLRKLTSTVNAYENAVMEMDDIVEHGKHIEMINPELLAQILEETSG
jgi:hypothetical protein